MIYLSGLQDVPVNLIEAAQLDGANWWQRLMNITIPMVSPITLFNLITGVIAMFQYFAQAMSWATAAAWARRSTPPCFTAFTCTRPVFILKMGYASAMAWILFFIILICTIMLLRVSNRFTLLLRVDDERNYSHPTPLSSPAFEAKTHPPA